MDTASNPSPAPIPAQNSPRSRQSRRSSAVARGITESSNLSLSGVVDQEQFLISSSSTTSSDSFPSKESSTMVAASDDASAFLAGLDAHAHSQLDDTENCGAAKKPAWSKPSNEAAVAEVGAVMGADSWPALSESARASPKSSSAHSLKALYHGTITAPQVSFSLHCSGFQVSLFRVFSFACAGSYAFVLSWLLFFLGILCGLIFIFVGCFSIVIYCLGNFTF